MTRLSHETIMENFLVFPFPFKPFIGNLWMDPATDQKVYYSMLVVLGILSINLCSSYPFFITQITYLTPHLFLVFFFLWLVHSSHILLAEIINISGKQLSTDFCVANCIFHSVTAMNEKSLCLYICFHKLEIIQSIVSSYWCCTIFILLYSKKAPSLSKNLSVCFHVFSEVFTSLSSSSLGPESCIKANWRLLIAHSYEWGL